MIAKDTVREEVWIRAYEASISRGFGISTAVELATECLSEFDKIFPNKEQHENSHG